MFMGQANVPPLKAFMSQSSEPAAQGEGPGAWLILSLAIACGVTVANLYYAQPLVGPISASFALGLATAGLIVAMIQLGYVLGLLFLVPLGDLVENKSLILLMLCCLVASLMISAAAPSAAIFIASSFLLGITAVGTQMILPVAAHLTPEHIRGQTVGTVMSGLLFGILLARPLSTLVAGEFGWRAVYLVSAAAMCAVVVLMARVLPRRRPQHTLTYATLIRSLWDLLLTTPVLQRRAAYQALLFGAFMLFWTAVPLLLQAPPFSLGHLALSAFMLSGVGGAFVAPVAGRLADRGYIAAVTGTTMIAVALSFVLAWIGSAGSVAIMVIAGILLDAGELCRGATRDLCAAGEYSEPAERALSGVCVLRRRAGIRSQRLRGLERRRAAVLRHRHRHRIGCAGAVCDGVFGAKKSLVLQKPPGG
jgi:predicted MFS family arabinose efflux permease